MNQKLKIKITSTLLLTILLAIGTTQTRHYRRLIIPERWYGHPCRLP